MRSVADLIGFSICFLRLVAATGVEPITLTYEASMMPFHYAALAPGPGIEPDKPSFGDSIPPSGPGKVTFLVAYLVAACRVTASRNRASCCHQASDAYLPVTRPLRQEASPPAAALPVQDQAYLDLGDVEHH